MIVTLDEFKEFIGVSGTNQDNLLTRILESANGLMEKETGRIFEKGERTDKFDGKGREELFLRNLPVVSITSVTVNDEAQTAAYYEFDEETGEFWHKDKWDFPTGRKNVKIVYQSGWLAAEAPEDLKQAIYSVASTIYKRKGTMGVVSESIGDYSVTFSENGFPKCVMHAIENYRTLNV